MAEIKYNIVQTDSIDMPGFETLTNVDAQLINSITIPTTFKANDNFIELSYYTLDGIKLTTIENYTNYSILSGDSLNSTIGNSEVTLDVLQDYRQYVFNDIEAIALYNFLDYSYSTTNTPEDFYIESISADRTELRLVSVNLQKAEVFNKTQELLSKIQQDVYSLNLQLYLGENTFYSSVNIDIEEYRDTYAVLVKLYEPLPSNVNLKVRLNIIEKVAESVSYRITTTITPDLPVVPTLGSPNFNVEIDVETTEPSGYYNYNELFSFPTNNSYRELNSLFNEKGAELSIDYTDFTNFINFSSAEERVRNFKYKLELVESYQYSLDVINNNLPNYIGVGVSGSREYFEGLINGLLNNLDHYERHLYYESGSTSWPKGNTSKPYINVGSSTGAAITWFDNEVLDASNYDLQNQNILINSIPSYLKEDLSNDAYVLFIHMIGQHFDNLWIYTDAISKKYDADNRLNRGVSKDLVEDLLKNFGVKLHTSNRSATDLFRYFTANSYEIDDIEPNLEPIITGSNHPISQNDYQKEIYKRIYHNLPLLMKSKGTERGLRALINCFGIPSETLQIRIYGGQSSQNTPFFGGEQAWTGSLDKIRLDNTGSRTENSTISQYTSIRTLDNFYTQDLHSIEVGFSPTHNVDNYILSQSAVLFPSSSFNIDNHIGDPRETTTNLYYSLRDYANEVFTGVDSYDLKDFIRLIKFFDNVIFRMVRDFIPARAVADTGIIIKPHLLERSKYESPAMSWTQPEFSGSIDTAFIIASSGGVYESFSQEILYPQAVAQVNTIVPSGSLITSYIETVTTPLGPEIHQWIDTRGNASYTRGHEEARFDGQLSGSSIVITDGELNRDNPFKNLDYSEVIYDVKFFKEIPEDSCIIQSLGTLSSPYILNSTGNPYNLASLFLYGTLQGFNYFVGGVPILTNPGEYSFDFSYGNQYGLEVIRAEGIINPSCVATTYCAKVICSMVFSGAQPNTYVYTDIYYNLLSWFERNDNTLSSIYINESPLTIAEAENYIFTGNEGELVEVKLQDIIDSNCKVIKTFRIRECSLLYNTPATTYVGTIPTQPESRPYYRVENCFIGTTSNTEYRVVINYEMPSGEINTYGPVNITSTGDAGQLLLENNPDNLYERYSGNPNNPSSLSYLFTNNNLLPSAIKSVAFSATNSGLCTAGTPNFTIPGPSVNQLALLRSMAYSPDGGNTACNILREIPIYCFESQLGAVILNQGYLIYEDDNGTTLAPAGYYSNTGQVQPGTSIYRYWNGSWWAESGINAC